MKDALFSRLALVIFILCAVTTLGPSAALFDDETIVLYFLGEESTEMQPIAEELGKHWQAKVLFNPVVEPVAQPGTSGGCGREGCGGGGCGV